MDFEDSEQDGLFRARARVWLDEHAPGHVVPAGVVLDGPELQAAARRWQATKAEGRFAGIRWPESMGGRGGSLIEETIFAEEESRYRLPSFIGIDMGLVMAVPTIGKHGTPAQLDRFAQGTLRGEVSWCQLFSEPNAGSDLAALQTTARREGDNWIVNGQKLWSSWAHLADWGMLLARTDPGQPKHKGLSFFLVDMRRPGIEVRPIRQLSGKSDFNETFLTDVVLPDECRVGSVGEGWGCAMTVLMSERGGAGNEVEIADIARLVDRARSMPHRGASLIEDGLVRDRFASWYASERGQENFRLRMLTKLSRGEPMGAEAALGKLAFANRLQQAAGFAMEMQGLAGATVAHGDALQAQIHEDYFWAAAMRVAGGADEVLRNQLAERVLGMPGEVRQDRHVPFEQLNRR